MVAVKRAGQLVVAVVTAVLPTTVPKDVLAAAVQALADVDALISAFRQYSTCVGEAGPVKASFNPPVDADW